MFLLISQKRDFNSREEEERTWDPTLGNLLEVLGSNDAGLVFHIVEGNTEVAHFINTTSPPLQGGTG